LVLIFNKKEKEKNMKNTMIRSMGLLAIMLAAHTSYAHDPSEHMKENEQPKCAAMDHSKMDMKDPVAQAMIKQCSMANQEMKKKGSQGMHSNMHDQKAMDMKAPSQDAHQH
jgi:cytochrome bd-type quinol oxidase subunit 1